jgi:hypothetical protein
MQRILWWFAQTSSLVNLINKIITFYYPSQIDGIECESHWFISLLFQKWENGSIAVWELFPS